MRVPRRAGPGSGPRKGAARGSHVPPPARGVSRVWLFVSVLALLATIVHATVFGRGPASLHAHLPWPLLVGLFALAEVATVRVYVRRHDYTHTLSETPLVLGLALASPTALVTARLVGTALVLGLRLRQAPHKLAYNLVKLWAETALAVLVYRALLGTAAVESPQGWLAAAGAVGASTAFALACLVAVVALYEGRLELGTFAWAPVATFAVAAANTSIGLLAVVTLAREPAAIGLVAVVALVTLVAYRAYASWRRRHEGLTRLQTLTHDAEPLPPPLAVRRILLQAADLMRAEGAELVVLDPRDDDRVLRAELGADGRITETWGSAAALLAQRRPAERRWRLPRLWARPAAALRVPLRGKTGVIGELKVTGRPRVEEALTTDDERLLETFANHASVALENSRLVEQLRDEVTVREHEASHDALTGLPNRNEFHQRVSAAIDTLPPDTRLAVLLVDLDHFKAINDTLGHHVGDTVLAQLAAGMTALLGPDASIARLGGDEFAVLLTGLDGPARARSAAERLRRAVAEPVVIDDLRFEVTGSIGIALCPDDGRDSSTLLRRADVAMYLAKHQRSGIELYRHDQDPNTPRRLRLAGELRVAIEQRELVVHYQPKASLETGEVEGVEALARWQHPVEGLVSPDEFIPLAEQTGLIRPLTRFVIESALAQRREWAARGHYLEVAVNLSPWNLLDGQVIDDLRRLLREYRVPSSGLRLEITESGMMTDPRRTALVLEQIHALGVGLSIDDFGTGYSSLSWLTRLPVDEVKIDRSFVQGILRDEGDHAIVRSTAELGRSLGLTVVAEGVEDRATWRELRALRCHAAQGYLLARPLPADAFLRWYEARKEQRPAPRRSRQGAAFVEGS